MTNINELNPNEDTKIEVEGISGWDKEKPHRIMLNLNIGGVIINGLVEEAGEYLNHSIDRELHDQTYEQVEIEKDKLAMENDILREENQFLKWEVEKYRERARLV